MRDTKRRICGGVAVPLLANSLLSLGDYQTTQDGLRAGYVELNPLAGSQRARISLEVGGTAALTGADLYFQHHGSKAQLWATRVLTWGARSWLIYHNLKVEQRRR